MEKKISKRANYQYDYELNPLTIEVIGVGGTGGFFCRELSRIAYAIHETLEAKHIEVNLYDFDEVEPHNIGRQTFLPSDIGFNKAEIMTKKINSAYGFDWKWFSDKMPKDIINGEMLDLFNHLSRIFVLCVDSVDARINVIKNIQKSDAKCLIIDAGNSSNLGQIRFLNSENKSELKDYIKWLQNIDADFSAPSCSLAMSIDEQGLFINTFLANLICSKIYELFKNKVLLLEDIYLNLDALKLTSKPIYV